MGRGETLLTPEPRRREPEFQAALANSALVLLVPLIGVFYLERTWTGVRPDGAAFRSAAINASLVLLVVTPIAFVVWWRTYVHARAYRVNPTTVWRGPCESAAIFGGIALLLMVRATAVSWGLRPFYLIIGYVAFYAGASAVAGLAFGLALAATALLVLHVRS